MKKTAKLKLKLKSKTPNKRKYIESHWLIFCIQGIVALLAGAFIMFTTSQEVSRLVSIIGTVLLGLAVIEIFNIIHRTRRQDSWGIPLGVALFEAGVGTAMIIASSQTHVLHIALLAGYTIVRGVASIFIGFISFKDNMTSRFFWVACGMVGAIIGFVILADQATNDTTFIRIFGTFLMVLGLTNIFYAIHSRDQLQKSKKSK